MEASEHYNKTCEIYDLRHSSPTTEHIRGFEIRLIEKFARSPLLDAGCGTGYHFPIYQKLKLDFTGIDLSQEMVSKAGPCASLGNIESLKFPDNSFGTICCFLSVLNTCNYKKAAKEFARVLKPGGSLILSLSSYWDLDWLPLEKRKKEKPIPGTTKVFKTLKSKFKLRLFTKQEILGLFPEPEFQLTHFDSCFSIAKPVWGDLKPFTKSQLDALEQERKVPKDLGAFYFFVFRKQSTTI